MESKQKGTFMIYKRLIPVILLLVLSALGFSSALSATPYTQNENADVVIEGPVQAINLNIITIADTEIVLNPADPVLPSLQVGNVIRVEGDIADNQGISVIQATTVVVTGTNIITPIVTITGPVQAINVNIVTIFNFDIQFNPNDPTLLVLEIGDIVQVSGNIIGANGTIVVVPVQVEIIVKVTPEVTPPPGGGVLIRGFVVTFVSRVFANNQTTFTYTVAGTGTPPDLSHFDIEIPVCVPPLQAVAYNPAQAVSFGVDPTTGVNGIKWDLSLRTNETRTYSITFAGDVPQGMVTVAVKGGNGFESAALPGPACRIVAVDIEKLISVDNGTTWQDADSAPGPEINLGTPVMFRFVVRNISQSELTNLALTDNVYDLSSCTIPASLAVGAFFECTIGPLNAEAGQHTNVATVTAVSANQQVQDTDSANYFGGDRPAVDIEKFVSTDNANWSDADTAPGLAVEAGDEVFFRFVVTNTGNVPLSTIGLTDDAYPINGCTIPATLEPAASFECVIGPLPAEASGHTNTATVTANYLDTPVTDSDSASYHITEEDVDQPVIIVIEGPIQAININIITILGIDIEIDPNDPILLTIKVGDTIRVEGTPTSDGGRIIIVAVNITIINIVIVNPPDTGGDDDDGGPIIVNPPPSSRFNKDACKGGGWRSLRRADGSGFKNQGDCIQYANTGK